MTRGGVFTKEQRSLNDDRLIERICAAYRHSYSVFGGVQASGGQWSIINGWKGAAHEALMSGVGAADLLRYPASNNFLYGFDVSCTEPLRTDNDQRIIYSATLVQTLELLAQYVGVVRIRNPEAPHALPDSDGSVEVMLRLIAHNLKTKLRFPNPFPDEFGLETSCGVISLRALFAVYQAYRLKTLQSMVSNKQILEVGGGLGRTAFYAYSIGLKHYTIIDLPLAGAAPSLFSRNDYRN